MGFPSATKYLTRNVKKASKTSVRKLQRRSGKRLPNTGVSGQSELSRMIHGVEQLGLYCTLLLYITVICCTFVYCTVQYNIVQYSTVHNHAICTGLVQFCTVLCCIVQ